MHEEEGLYLFDTRDAQVFIDFMPQQAVEADELFVRLEYKQIGADVFERLLRYKDEFIRRASGPDQQLAAKMAEVRLEMENLRLSVYRKDQLISAKEEELEDMRHKLREKVQDLQLILQSRSYKISRLMSLAFSMILPGKFRVMNRKIRYFITGTSLLKKSGWFDEDYYLKNNPDIRVKGRLAIWHYLVHGGFEGRRPCEGFDSAYYLRSNPDVLYGNMNPLLHFVLYGEKEKRLPEAINAGTAYADWIEQFDTVSETDREEMRKAIAAFPVKPLISVVMPVYDPKPEWLKEAIDSVIGQTYPSWELCIADDCSKNPLIHKILKEYREKEPRIKVAFRETNGHISAASNSALELVTGDYIALLDHDDKLPVQALYWVARTINDHPQAKLIYSDEDKIDSGGSRLMPYFKCDWNPELFYAQNLVSHLGVFKTEIVKEIGGFRTGYEGSQDYDLTLRFIEKAQREEIVHIPRVLYHWRMHENSVAQNPGSKAYAYTAAVKSINDHLSRIKSPARVEQQNIGSYRLMYPVPASNPLVSIIIPTRNQFSLLRTCIESILSKTAYPNYEVIIIDNNSDEPDTLQYLSGIERDSHLRCLKYQLPFNFSAITNFGVAAARGEFICLMNDDIEVIHSDWLAEMLGNACQPGIGAVGARLFYPNHTIQHAGVILGINGVAAHAFKCYPYDSHGYFGRLIATQELSAVTAACMLFRKSAFEQVGGFNEKELTIAFNDIDFCLKLKEAGYRNIYTPFARFYHHESASRGAEDTDEKKLRFSDETDYMRERWGTLLDQDPAYNPNLTLVYEDFSLAWPPRGGQKY